jgi:4-amino-4-deoxy-L-arabinose transferase-like glycosyltransferase
VNLPHSPSDVPASRRRVIAALAVIAVLAIAVRGAAVWFLADGLSHDTDGYRAVAQSLLEHGDFLRDGRPTAWRPPLYPLLLAKLLWIAEHLSTANADHTFVFLVGLTQVVCGALTVLLVARLGWRVGLGRWSLLAAAFVACDPLLAHQSAQLMTETLATLLAVVAWSLLDTFLVGSTAANPGERKVPSRYSRLKAAALGLALGLATLCRPTFLPWVALLLLWLAWSAARQRQFARVTAVAVAVAFTLSPWAIRNWIEIGRPIITTTHGGYTLLLANNERFYEWTRDGAWGTVWDSREFVDDWLARKQAADIDNELDEDRLARRLALETMRADPGGFARATGVRLARFWNVSPHLIQSTPQATGHAGRLERASTRWLIASWYLAEFALALCGLASAARSPNRATWLAGVLLVVVLSVVHSVYWSDLRMRAPAMPVVALLAAAGAGRLLSRGAVASERA